jgi:hypothetical protein
MEEALLTDKRQVPIMKGYALLLEEHGRCGVGHDRGWSFKMAVIWYLKVLRVYERSSDASHGGKPSNKSFGRTIVSLLHVAYLLKLQGKREDAIVKFQRIALVFQDVLTKSQGLSGQGAMQQHLARSLLGAVRCDIAVLMRDIGRQSSSSRGESCTANSSCNCNNSSLPSTATGRQRGAEARRRVCLEKRRRGIRAATSAAAPTRC